MAISEDFNPDSSFRINELIKFLQALPEAKKLLIKEVVKIAKIMLVMPATNALSERSFSALRRLTTYLCSTTTNLRLNNMLTLHIHKDETSNLDLCNVISCKNVIKIHKNFRYFGVLSFTFWISTFIALRQIT